jgi:hypothetical protein
MESKISLQQHHEARIAAVSRTPPFKKVHCCKYCSRLRIIIDKDWAPRPGTSKCSKAFLIENLTKELFQSAVNSNCAFFENARPNEHRLLKSPFRLEVSSQRDKKLSVSLAPGIFRRKNIWRNVFPDYNDISLEESAYKFAILHLSCLGSWRSRVGRACMAV